eukprot:5172671-Pleurochrysis_carterae.AAC.1
MYAVAEVGDITLRWCCVLDACIAKHRKWTLRAFDGRASVARVVTRHSYRPPKRLKGRTRRSPLDVGGEMMAFTSANLHSVEDDSQSALTDSNESLKLGAQR